MVDTFSAYCAHLKTTVSTVCDFHIQYRRSIGWWLIDWLIGDIVVLAVFLPVDGGCRYLNFKFKISRFLWRPSLVYFPSKYRARSFSCLEVVMLDTGHHLTSHSTDMQKINERTRHYIFIHIYTYRFCVDYLRPSEIKLFLIGAIFELEPVFTFHHSATVGVD